MTDHELLESLYALRWLGAGLGLLNLFVLVALLILKRLQYRWDRHQNTEYMDELRTLLTAARVAAESARANNKDATSARADMAKKSDESVARLEQTIPEKTADKVEERLHGSNGGNT
jgi:hypothetical protein